MTPEQMQNFRTILERAEFLSVRELVEDREDMWREPRAGVRAHASTVGGVSAASCNLGHRAGSLAEIRDALERLEDDKFGSCVSCGQAVGLGRLTAMPWTAFCLDCEENAEAVDAMSPDLTFARTNEAPEIPVQPGLEEDMSEADCVSGSAAARGGLGSQPEARGDIRCAGTASRLTILVADDDDAIRTLTGGALRNHGYNVLQAADGVEALEVAAQHPGPIHLLLTDVSMPRLDGWGLHRRMRSDRPGTTTLFMSGSLDPGQHQQAAFLPKPFTVSALIHKVTEALNFSAGSFTSG